MNFVDIHTHILPGVDDGAATVDETIAMLSLAHATGTRKIVATPHMFYDLFQNNDSVEIKDHFEELQWELNASQQTFPFLSEIVICPGAENYVSPKFLEALEQGRVLTLNGSRYLLVEVPFMMPFGQIRNVVQRVFWAGYTPVLAHVERYGAVQEQSGRLAKLREDGLVVQVNGDSLWGASGSRAKKCIRTLLAEDLVDVIASDGHHADSRTPQLQAAFQQLKGEFGKEDLMRWMREKPDRILANRSLEVSAGQ